VIDSILNDSKAWKNDSKALFQHIKRKSEAKWTRPTIQEVIRETEGSVGSRNEMTYKVTNPEIYNDRF